MVFSNKSSFLGVFLLVFSVTLFVLGSVQAIFGTLRWYNASEQWHEELQNYPIYSASETPTQSGVIRVFIAPKPTTTESNVYVFLQNTASLRQEALTTVTPEKAQIINQKVEDVLQQGSTPVTPSEAQPFQTPVVIGVTPESAFMPNGYT